MALALALLSLRATFSRGCWVGYSLHPPGGMLALARVDSSLFKLLLLGRSSRLAGFYLFYSPFSWRWLCAGSGGEESCPSDSLAPPVPTLKEAQAAKVHGRTPSVVSFQERTRRSTTRKELPYPPSQPASNWYSPTPRTRKVYCSSC